MTRAAFVTGATGVIGHALAERLLSRGQKVVASMRLHPHPTDIQARRADAFELLTKKHGDRLLPLAADEVIDYPALTRAKESLKDCEVIYHMGGWAVHKISEETLPQALAANVLWTGALARLAAEQKVKRFVFASTRAVYDFPGVPFIVNEETPITLPLDLAQWKDRALLAFDDYLGSFLRGKGELSPEEFCREYLFKNPPPSSLPKNLWYAMSKFMAEEMVAKLWDKEVESVRLRLKPVFGPSPVEHDSRTIPRTIKRLLEKGTETAWPESCGYLYLEDLIFALEALNPNDKGIPNLGREHGLFLLGNHRQSLSQYNLFRDIAALLGPRFQANLDATHPAREDELFDVSRAMQALQFKNTPFSYALERTVRYFADYSFLQKALQLAARGEPENVCRIRTESSI